MWSIERCTICSDCHSNSVHTSQKTGEGTANHSLYKCTVYISRTHSLNYTPDRMRSLTDRSLALRNRRTATCVCVSSADCAAPLFGLCDSLSSDLYASLLIIAIGWMHRLRFTGTHSNGDSPALVTVAGSNRIRCGIAQSKVWVLKLCVFDISEKLFRTPDSADDRVTIAVGHINTS